MAKKKVFISFDFDNDKTLKDFIVGQANLENSPFEISDVSLKEAAPEKDWEEKAEAKIKKADRVIVMVGTKTHSASGVKKEVKMARENSIKIAQIKGHSDKNCPKVDNAGVYYNWSWDNIEKILED